MAWSSAQCDYLIAQGWRRSCRPFWRETPCFYDLSQTKTVLLLFDACGGVDEADFFWKPEWQELPNGIEPSAVQVRRYKLHHSMNALLWHDYGEQRIVH